MKVTDATRGDTSRNESLGVRMTYTYSGGGSLGDGLGETLGLAESEKLGLMLMDPLALKLADGDSEGEALSDGDGD